MNVKLYVGNLSYSVNDSQLSDHFAQAGTVVSARVITDRDSGRSRGFGFVEMASEQDAQKAQEMFHGQDFQGRNLVVNEARPQTPRGGGQTQAPQNAPQAPTEAPEETPSETTNDQSAVEEAPAEEASTEETTAEEPKAEEDTAEKDTAEEEKE